MELKIIHQMMKVMMKFICSVGNKSTDKQHPINIGNKEINILIDIGSTLNVLDEKTYKMFDPVTILVSSETMAYYVPDAKTKVIVDASPIVLGAIPQKQKTGEAPPVVYTSKALNPTEQRYPQTERESLALLWV